LLWIFIYWNFTLFGQFSARLGCLASPILLLSQMTATVDDLLGGRLAQFSLNVKYELVGSSLTLSGFARVDRQGKWREAWCLVTKAPKMREIPTTQV
jgi:hypothetical protein